MTDQKNEGEGNRTAARQYNESAKDHAEHADVEKLAQKAKAATEGGEAADLKKAREDAKKRAAQHDPEETRD